MKAVLDTGIFVSALISSQGFPYKAVDLWIDKRFDLVTSTWQIQELREVSRYPRVTPLAVSHHVGAIVNRLRNHATVLDALPEVDYSDDPKDTPILATGIAGGVRYIVSGDKGDLLALKEVEGISIVSAREFVGLFTKPG